MDYFFMKEFKLIFETEDSDHSIDFLFDADFHLFIENLSSVVRVKRSMHTLSKTNGKMVSEFTFESKLVSGYTPESLLGAIWSYK